MAYLSTIGTTAQVLFSRIDGSAWKQLTARDDGVVEATLSGDGSTVFTVTGDGSMLRIDTATGSTTTLVGFTPTVSSSGYVTPGSLDSLQGTGLQNTSVRIAGLLASIVGRSTTTIWFQVPWETPPGVQSLTIPEGGAPYFDDAVSYQLDSFLPQALSLAPSTGLIAVHSDFGSLVSADSPAAPGEIVHLYLKGGGPVSPPVATGVFTPLTPLSQVTTPFSVVADRQQTLQVLFFGLAPGMLGVWQMDVAMPSTWPRPALSLEVDFYSPPPNSFAASIGLGGIAIKAAP
ncbi:MAG TPA: hypothetical protein VGN17_27370 [Bryobacteraceae bacterium]